VNVRDGWPELVPLYDELEGYFAALAQAGPEGAMRERIAPLWQEMDAYAAANPTCPAPLLKAQLHEVIAARFAPVLFAHSPFYFEMGLRPAQNWGVGRGLSAGAWMRERRQQARVDPQAWRNLQHFAAAEIARPIVFDEDHRSLGYSGLLREGVRGLQERIRTRRRTARDGGEAAFLEAAERSSAAVLTVARRFAEEARRRLDAEPDAEARRFLGLIADTAARVPAEPPRTFYEGLAALWFLRETAATLEGVGISVIGHPDRQLIGLYRADLAAGRLDEREARDLLARWMLPTDIRFRVQEEAWPETSTCMELGGCDEEGAPVYNELTRLILDVHQHLGLLNPKPNCRYSASSSEEYLELISAQVLAGHNVFALQNDGVIIPALVRQGRSAGDARLYVNGGCQETICEGSEHSAGAYYYFNLARVLDLCLLGEDTPVAAERWSAEAAARVPRPIADAPDWDAFHARFLAALYDTIAAGAEWRRLGAAQWSEINPCPFYSATLKGCIETGRDYSAGGALYNDAGIAPVGFATLVDSLFALRIAVFEERWVTLEALRAALRQNWEGHEALRARLVALPKFGHGHAGVDALAAEISRGLAAFVRTLRNERGGRFQPSLFVYYAFVQMGQVVRATPDGRRAGDILSQGAGPSAVRPARSITAIAQSISRVDYTDHPGNAVIDIQLPYGGQVRPEELAAFTRTFARLGGATIQYNCVSAETLRAAQLAPDEHRDLQVRICGLSAYFVTLQRPVQDELIARAAQSF
jgi:formate C-acetyltransferase